MDGKPNRDILKELKEMNQSLRSIHEKLDEQEKRVTPFQTLFDMMKSLLIGFLIVGPLFAILYGGFHILSSYTF